MHGISAMTGVSTAYLRGYDLGESDHDEFQETTFSIIDVGPDICLNECPYLFDEGKFWVTYGTENPKVTYKNMRIG